MIIPFIPEDLFELNNNLQPQFDGEVIIIDNLFKNFEDITKICNNIPVEQWKSSPTSRNFKDYYDCRPVFNNFFPNEDKTNGRLSILTNFISYYYSINSSIKVSKGFNFNYYKNIKSDIPSNLQHHPHTDHYFNCIVYMDPYENGGTALYEDANLPDTEANNILYNIENLSIKKIIDQKPNRCVIFPGNILHGGYIKDHNLYRDNWRINLVHFFEK